MIKDNLAIQESLSALDRFKRTLQYAKEGMPFKGMITYKELSEIKILDTVPIEGYKEAKIYSPKIHQNDDLIVFLTILKPKQQFNGHEHDCPENIYVVQGCLKDRMRSWSLNTGKTFVYKKKGGHAPYNPSDTEDTILIVTFNNPDKNED